MYAGDGPWWKISQNLVSLGNAPKKFKKKVYLKVLKEIPVLLRIH